jgi:arabinose-5-phosphate isomerase
LKVQQIMRKADQMALVKRGDPIREVLHAMARARGGCAVILEENGTLAGIFTHGDFGRHFQTHADLLEKPVGEFMTVEPITVGAGKLAAEVLHILEHHRIDDLVVVDENGCPVGLVDTQDLARFKLL